MSSINQDRTANRVALCSAIFAGFAYVGYAVVRTAFGGRKFNNGFFRNENDCLGLEYDSSDRKGRVYMRRLSGSSYKTSKKEMLAAAAAGLTQVNQDDNAEVPVSIDSVLRPLSVRERLRELNLNAMAFADTLLILHGKKPLMGPRSLQSSPFHSPTRILSPLDVSRQFLMYDEEHQDNPDEVVTPHLSRRASRRNLSRRSLANSVVNLSEEQQGEAAATAQSLFCEREAELTRRLESFQSSRPRELTPYESKSLVALLHSRDKETISRTLITISNCAAFTRNQDLLREAGLLVLLPSLIADQDTSVQMAAVLAASNLALNTGNMKEMEQVVLVMVVLAGDAKRMETQSELFTQILLSLTNLAVLPDWHHHFHSLLPVLLEILTSDNDAASDKMRYQASRLLVNLTCHDANISHILNTKLPGHVSKLISRGIQQDQLLRNVTFLSNVICSSLRLAVLDLKALKSGCNGEFDDGKLLSKLIDPFLLKEAIWLADNHKNSDVRMQSRKIRVALS